MKKRILSLILFSLIVIDTYATVDTHLTLVSNTHNSPSLGIGTLVINVEAMSSSVDVQINVFQDAFQVDANLRLQIQSLNDVTFSNQNFPSSSYTTSEEYRSSDGRISYIYTFSSGTRASISSSGWTVAVTVTIKYTMTPANSTVNWFSGIPNYFVTNNLNADSTGSELSIPSDLINFALPVELNSFNAKIKGANVELLWQTKTEINNYGFEVERLQYYKNAKLQDSKWEKIGFVDGNGNSNSPKDYSFIDKNLTGGSKFTYRLKQVDNDGTYSYSNEVEVEVIPDKYELYQNYPNPFNPVTNIKFSLPTNSKVKLDIFNIIGEKVATLLDKDMEAGFYSIPFNAINLSSGTYIYRIQAQGFSQTKKMLLIK